jgi:hypothetical protein
MKRYPLLLLVCGVLAGLVGLWLFLKNKPQTHALQARSVATRVLAEYLVRVKAGQQVLVISNPFVRRPGVDSQVAATEAAGLRGLKEGFGSKLKMKAPVFPDLRSAAEQNPRAVAIDPETTTPLSFLVAEHAFDTLAEAHPDCDLIVSLIGVPVGLHGLRCWQTTGAPRFALLLPDLRLIGNLQAVRGALQGGKLVAFVLHKPGAPSAETGLSGRVQAEFDQRFLLVTAANIDRLVQNYPKLFPGN